MESWSRFNRLFRTERYGGFLYGALANVLFKLDDPHWEAARALRDAAAGGAAPEPATARDDDAFLAALREHSILIEPRQEEAQLLARRYARLTAAFDTSELGLTVCPTLACNFRCPYCFEASQGDRTVMSPETVSRLVTFIERHRDARRVALAWYGGEPTLAWGVVRDVTERVKRLDIDFEHAALVTNGYLLDAAKIAALGDLMIDSIQITLDGPRDVHDSRRVHAEGGPTYDRILENVDRLMSSGYEGRCAIRVNVDRDNADRFAGLRRELLERFDGTRLTVYAGHVHVDPGHPYGCGCSFDGDEWAAFTLDLYAREALLPTRGFHPPTHPHGCVANAHQGFVVGPAGELYKCWEDVGRPEMIIGDLYADEPVTDPGLRARYALGTDPYADEECLACDVLPVCGGGCPNKRLRARQLGEPGLEYCGPYRHHLEQYLEAYYDAVLTREICAAVLGAGPAPQDDRGWRVVSPAASPGSGPRPADGPIPSDA